MNEATGSPRFLCEEETDSSLTNEVRIEQSCRHLSTLRSDINQWIQRRLQRDVLKQYATQLGALKTQFTFILGEIQRALGEVSPVGARGEVYQTCRLFDQRTLWLRRLWEYFQTRFDQRDDNRWKDVLAAADEVVWSCYAQPFRVTRLPQGASPLPYVAPWYSPQAIPRSEPPQDLRGDVDASFLNEMLKQLPVPTLGLPPSCAEDPWWLVYLAHEVGHHVQFDLLADERLIDEFRGLLSNAVKASGANAGEAAPNRWAYWGEEIFADVFSLLTVGPAALWALTELVWTDDEGMMDDSNPRYPSPLVRLQLMAAVLDELELDGTAALLGTDSRTPARRELPLGPRERYLQTAAREDLRLVRPIARAILNEPLGTLDALPVLCDWRAADFKSVAGRRSMVRLWADMLLGRANATVENTLKAARLVLSGGLAAWAEMSMIPDPKSREAGRIALKPVLVTTILQSREESVRSATLESDSALKAKGQRLADLLLRGDPARLRV